MTLFLTSLPIWLTFLIIVVLPTALAIGGLLLIRQKIGIELLAANNEVAGFKFAVVGVIYAVMLGFAVIVVWDRFHDAEDAAAKETSGVIAVSRLAKGLGGGTGEPIQQRLTDYVRAAIDIDWPAMAEGRRSTPVGETLSALYAAVLAILAPMSGKPRSSPSCSISSIPSRRRGARGCCLPAARCPKCSGACC